MNDLKKCTIEVHKSKHFGNHYIGVSNHDSNFYSINTSNFRKFLIVSYVSK